MSALLELMPLFKRLYWHKTFVIGLACARPFIFVNRLKTWKVSIRRTEKRGVFIGTFAVCVCFFVVCCSNIVTAGVKYSTVT